jgi:TonB-dependent receptor
LYKSKLARLAYSIHLIEDTLEFLSNSTQTTTTVKKRTILSRLKMQVMLFGAIFCMYTTHTIAQGNRITGVITDELTGEGLIGANVAIEGLYIGAASDLTGHFEVVGIPDGPFTLLIKYIGYEDKSMDFESVPEEPISIALKSIAIQGEEVVITALARGQLGAINTQINALQIKNVVSAARIEELPDATAAEAIGRLPGISINRSGGEANKVSVRGLGPKYNSVTVEGVTLLSTSADDRSTDISMIAPNVLSGIDVTKALSADMMANSLGGTVNMTLREAKEGLHLDFSAQGGYNGNSESISDYKLTGAISNRFLDNKLGIYLGGYMEQRYRGKDILDANWLEDFDISEDFRDTAVVLDQITYQSIDEQRKRFGGSLVIDYKWDWGKLKLVNFGSRMDRNLQRHSQGFGGRNSNTINYHVYESGPNYQTQMVNKLGGEFNLFTGKLTIGLAHAMANIDNPKGLQVGAWGVYTPDFDKTDLFESGELVFQDLVNYIHPFGSADDAGIASLAPGQPTFTSENGTDREYTANIDYQLPYSIGEALSGFVKAGYMYKKKFRFYDFQSLSIPVASGRYNADIAARDYFNDIYTEPPSSQYSLDVIQSWDDHFDLDKFYGGKYNLYKFMALDHMHDYAGFLEDYYAQNGYIMLQNVSSYEKDQEGTETYNNAYLMAELGVFNGRLRLIPGIRYEKVDYLYDALHIIQPRGSVENLGSYVDTVSSPAISHTNLFPSIHLIAKVTDWMDVRLAYTETVSRPNYTAIIPRLSYDPNSDPRSVIAGNVNLEPELSRNYDAYVSFYQNKFGLFTAGVYYKQISDLIYTNTYRLIDSAQADLVGADYEYLGTNYQVSRNNDWEATLFGLEFDFQTNFHYLPRPLNGLVLNANFTYNDSETSYYGYILRDTMIQDPNTGRFRPSKISRDTSYVGPILGMKKYIFNVSVGYEIGGFSAHVSYLYQSPSQNNRDPKDYLSIFSQSYSRVDIKARYKFDMGLEVFLNFNNITQTGDITYRNTSRDTGYYTEQEEFYGMNMHLGLRYRL